jgi:hypothetical protein
VGDSTVSKEDINNTPLCTEMLVIKAILEGDESRANSILRDAMSFTERKNMSSLCSTIIGMCERVGDDTYGFFEDYA